MVVLIESVEGVSHPAQSIIRCGGGSCAVRAQGGLAALTLVNKSWKKGLGLNSERSVRWRNT